MCNRKQVFTLSSGGGGRDPSHLDRIIYGVTVQHLPKKTILIKTVAKTIELMYFNDNSVNTQPIQTIESFHENWINYSQNHGKCSWPLKSLPGLQDQKPTSHY